MATFSPPPPTSQPLSTEFGPSSPPDQSYHNTRNGIPQRGDSTQSASSKRIQHRLSTDFKSNGHAPGFANGNGGMPVPTGLQHHAPNGASRHRGTVSMGAFDGPRSPPNTKSTPRNHDQNWTESKTDRKLRRYFTCALQVLQNGTVPGWESLSVFSLHRYLNC